jgi:hypothetical protein
MNESIRSALGSSTAITTRGRAVRSIGRGNAVMGTKTWGEESKMVVAPARTSALENATNITGPNIMQRIKFQR